MDRSRDSDILKTQMDFADLSTQEQSEFAAAAGINDDSLYPIEMAKGFCVKDFEEQLTSLKKENFNLKLRIYFLEEKNPNIPLGAETIYKQNVDLKIENENLNISVEEKRDLLRQASQALELVEKERENDYKQSQMVIEELNQKIEGLNHELTAMQNALTDSKKSNVGNDTGYADFLGAVDSKDVERQKLLDELKETEANFKVQMSSMNETMKKLQVEKKEIESKSSKLLFDNNAMKEKLASFLKNKNDELQNKNLENELQEFKDKWAATQCDLQDTEEKLKEVDHEREKTLKLLKNTLESLEKEREKCSQLAENLAELSENKSSGEQQKLLVQKTNEIAKLQGELSETKRSLQLMTNQELQEKDREIKKLSSLVKSLQSDRNTSMSHSNRFSLEQLSDSFNDLKFQQAMAEKKQSQKKIDDLMSSLADITHAQTKHHVEELQTQMAIVVEKQEVTDTALEKCAEICGVTLSHLQELAHFLNALLQQKEIRESLSEMTMYNIQSAIDKTLEYSQNAGRFSVDGRLSSLPNLSSMELFMSAARSSLANVQEIRNVEKSTYDAASDETNERLKAARKELDDIGRVNQVLEDEIISLKELVKKQEKKMLQHQQEMEENAKTKELLNADLDAAQKAVDAYEKKVNNRLQESQKIMDDLNAKCEILEINLQAANVKKFANEDRAIASENSLAKMTQQLNNLQSDLTSNWITKLEHNSVVAKFEEDIKVKETQIVDLWTEYDDYRKAKEDVVLEPLASYSESVAQAADQSNDEVFKASLRKIEISEDRKRLLTSTGEHELVSSSSDALACEMCPKYQAKIVELKKYLSRAVDKIKMQEEKKAFETSAIQKRLTHTESFLQTARSNLENILQNRNVNKE